MSANVAWLTDSSQAEGLWDLTQHYLGWVFYRKSPWHFPLGLVEGIYSQPVSIVYTDSIPLFALLFKILSPLLPANFQYFGLFELLSYALMGGFGALFVRAFSKRSQICLLSSLFFCPVTGHVETDFLSYGVVCPLFDPGGILSLGLER